MKKNITRRLMTALLAAAGAAAWPCSWAVLYWVR